MRTLSFLRGWAPATALSILCGVTACTHSASPYVPSEPALREASLERPAAATGAYAQSVLASGPIAYYRLDDSGRTAVDSGPNGLNGTYGAGVALHAAGLVPSASDAAAAFPGRQNASGTVSVAPNAKFKVTTELSLECFLRLTTVAKNYAVPIAYGSDYGTAPYDLYLSGGKLNAQFATTSGVLVVTSPTALATSVTYAIVATYDGRTGRLYVNGALAASANETGSLTGYDATHGFSIGDDAGFSDPGFSGTLDEVAVYAKALAPSEVAAHYAAATGRTQPTPMPTATAAPPGKYVDWPTFGFEAGRSGDNSSESTLATGNVGSLALAWTFSLGNTVRAAPVLASAVSTARGKENVLYVGSSAGKFVALDADTGALVWQKQLASVTYRCGDTQISGVDRAATFDRATNRIYVEDGTNAVHALDMAKGTEAAGWPVRVANVVAGKDLPHGALNYDPSEHLLYATTSSSCDISPWHGRVVAIDTQTAKESAAFYTVPSGDGGGIWGQGGVALDVRTKDVFAAIGNTDTTHGAAQNFGYGEHVVALDSALSVIASNSPTLPGADVYDDLDFGATPLLFTPPGCQPLAAAINKSGLLVVYKRANVGAGVVQAIDLNPPTSDADFIGIPAYSPATNELYVSLPNDYTGTAARYRHGLIALAVAGCKLDPVPVWNASFGVLPMDETVDDPHSPPVVANGVVYATDGPNHTLYAFDARTGRALWNSGGTIGGAGAYAEPLVDKNVYQTTYGGTVYAFGLRDAGAVRGAAAPASSGGQPERGRYEERRGHTN